MGLNSTFCMDGSVNPGILTGHTAWPWRKLRTPAPRGEPPRTCPQLPVGPRGSVHCVCPQVRVNGRRPLHRVQAAQLGPPVCRGWPGPLAFAGLTAVCRSAPVVGIRATSGFHWIPAQASLLLSCGPGPPCGLRRAGVFLVQVGGPWPRCSGSPQRCCVGWVAGWQLGGFVAS